MDLDRKDASIVDSKDNILPGFKSATNTLCPIEWYFVLVSHQCGLNPQEQSVGILILIERLCIKATQRG